MRLADARIGLPRDSQHDHCAGEPVDEDLPWQLAARTSETSNMAGLSHDQVLFPRHARIRSEQAFS
jgi:hypothetical protein